MQFILFLDIAMPRNILHFGLNINRTTYSTSSHIFSSSLTFSSIHTFTLIHILSFSPLPSSPPPPLFSCCSRFFNISTPIKYCVYFSFFHSCYAVLCYHSISHTLTFSFSLSALRMRKSIMYYQKRV